jgi:hypothetical protein
MNHVDLIHTPCKYVRMEATYAHTQYNQTTQLIEGGIIIGAQAWIEAS